MNFLRLYNHDIRCHMEVMLYYTTYIFKQIKEFVKDFDQEIKMSDAL